MIRVGGRKVLMNDTLFVPDGEEAIVDCAVGEGDNLTFKFQFVHEPDVEVDGVSKSPDPRYAVEYVTAEGEKKIDQLVVIFYNFNKPFGQSFKEPVGVADSNKREIIYLFAALQKLGVVTRIDFQVTLEDIV
ncbi:hypothetical protein [Pseudomonas sp. G166]|uniref:hypothetical protein n=1 Tax=Pseudomonas sp. G166 TaxID=3094846 RepID=UPI00300AB7C0